MIIAWHQNCISVLRNWVYKVSSWQSDKMNSCPTPTVVLRTCGIRFMHRRERRGDTEAWAQIILLEEDRKSNGPNIGRVQETNPFSACQVHKNTIICTLNSIFEAVQYRPLSSTEGRAPRDARWNISVWNIKKVMKILKYFKILFEIFHETFNFQ